MATDFNPITRREYLSSTDAARFVKGMAADIYLTKIGAQDPPDLSDIEVVQMGHVMQPVIGKLYAVRTGFQVRDADYQLTHKTHPWLRSSYDFEVSRGDGAYPMEAKNFGAHTRRDFGDDGSQIVRKDIFAQCVIEAACMGVNRVDLAILFGGQEFCIYPLAITEQDKDDLIQQLAVLWGNIQTRTPPAPETIEAARALFPVSTAGVIVANAPVEQACAQLKQIKDQIKQLETAESQLQAMIQGYMGELDTIVSFDGKPLATWKSAKGSVRFDSKMFQESMPDVYQSFMREAPGSRRFLVK